MGRPSKPERLMPAGPDELYRHGNGWRFFRCRAGVPKEPSETFLSKVKAVQAKRDEQALLDGRTNLSVGEALIKYEPWMTEEGHRNEGGNKPGPVEDTLYKIGALLIDKDEALESLSDPRRCQALYDDLRARIKPQSLARCNKKFAAWLTQHPGLTELRLAQGWSGKGVPPANARCTLVAARAENRAEILAAELERLTCYCAPYAVDSHRQMLLETKTFLRWCVGRGYMSKSGFEPDEDRHQPGVRGRGKRIEGKDQLRVDDARKFLDQAMFNLSVRGEEQALACMMPVLMGLSGTEITERLVEDVDDNCTRLWITNGKTRAREKVVDIPAELQPFVRVLIENRQPKDNLWTSHHWRDWIRRGVRKICEQAGLKLVSGHSMRALYGTLDYLGGAEQEQAKTAANMRHAPGAFATTTGPKYIQPDALRRRTQQRVRGVLGFLKGGKGG